MAQRCRHLRPGIARLLPGCRAVDEGLSLPAVHHLRRVQHHQRQFHDRFARRAARRLGHRFQPPIHEHLIFSDRRLSMGRALAAFGIRIAQPALEYHRSGLWRRPIFLQRRLHAAEQLGAAQRPGAGMGPVSSRSADRADRDRRLARRQLQSVRNQRPGRLAAGLARALRAGRLALQSEPDFEPRRPHGADAGNVGGAGSRVGRFRPDSQQPDRVSRAGQLRQESDRGDSGRPIRSEGRPAVRAWRYL